MIPDVQSHFETPKKIGLNPQKSYDFLITLVTIMFISGGYAIWFISTYLYAYDEADFVYTPKVHRAKAAEVATSTVDTTDWQTYRNEEYGFEFKYPNRLKEDEEAPAKDNDIVLECFNTGSRGSSFCVSLYSQPLIKSNIRTIYGLVEQERIQETKVANNNAYHFTTGDAGCGGPEYRIYVDNTKHLSINFFNCELSEPYITAKEIDKILSTFKFIPQ